MALLLASTTMLPASALLLGPALTVRVSVILCVVHSLIAAVRISLLRPIAWALQVPFLVVVVLVDAYTGLSAPLARWIVGLNVPEKAHSLLVFGEPLFVMVVVILTSDGLAWIMRRRETVGKSLVLGGSFCAALFATQTFYSVWSRDDLIAGSHSAVVVSSLLAVTLVVLSLVIDRAVLTEPLILALYFSLMAATYLPVRAASTHQPLDAPPQAVSFDLDLDPFPDCDGNAASYHCLSGILFTLRSRVDTLGEYVARLATVAATRARVSWANLSGAGALLLLRQAVLLVCAVDHRFWRLTDVGIADEDTEQTDEIGHSRGPDSEGSRLIATVLYTATITHLALLFSHSSLLTPSVFSALTGPIIGSILYFYYCLK